MSQREEILCLVERIPPFSRVGQEALGLLNEERASARKFLEVLRQDRIIAANLLKICNSAYFGLRRQVPSLEEAVKVLGRDSLQHMVMTGSSAPYFKGAAGEGYELRPGALWRHSVATALTGRRLMRHMPGVSPGTVFSAGLLHDIGKKFLSSFVADEFDRIIQVVNREKCAFVEAERQMLGIDHAQLGGIILKKWNFPSALVKAVTRHHDPDALRQESLTALLALSNVLVVSAGIGVGAEGLATALHGEALKRFGITQPLLDLCMADLLRDLKQARELSLL